MVFTYVENFSYVKKSPKYIQLERHVDQSLNKFIGELKSSNICEQLQDHVDIKVFNMYKNDIKQTWAIIKDTLKNKAREELLNQSSYCGKRSYFN